MDAEIWNNSTIAVSSAYFHNSAILSPCEYRWCTSKEFCEVNIMLRNFTYIILLQNLIMFLTKFSMVVHSNIITKKHHTDKYAHVYNPVHKTKYSKINLFSYCISFKAAGFWHLCSGHVRVSLFHLIADWINGFFIFIHPQVLTDTWWNEIKFK